MLIDANQLQIVLFQESFYLGNIFRVNAKLGQLSGSNYLLMMSGSDTGIKPDSNRMTWRQLSKLLQLT